MKYKYTSLVAGALIIAVASGVGGAFLYKENIVKKQIQRIQKDILQMQDECFGKMSKLMEKIVKYEALKEPNHFDKALSSSQYEKGSKEHNSPTKGLLEKNTTSSAGVNMHQPSNSAQTSPQHEENHDNKDGSCCGACMQGLSCAGDKPKQGIKKDMN